MEVVLHRTYFKQGTNGALFINGAFFGFSIELPWLNNARGTSCIPEGEYLLLPRYSTRFKHHLLVSEVKDRRLILIHAANDAQRDLRGCIAPVTVLSGIGKGYDSRPLLNRFVALCYQRFEQDLPVHLKITSTPLITY
ncbi:DUF5675 family protein [Neotamlana laminarinivorans]|uniref:DUF5675 family protein n=1 Tax=Neotamlana laminarinivorans TaxID=2883124 RepID=A0A9X1I1E9_9FLAO|nr:DUF5675 family protein [Tamlana laminarinivorans]MCB4800033.1 DUF5675 family protein [Tamlana laminarinivorans]